jgi:hypothetical protein
MVSSENKAPKSFLGKAWYSLVHLARWIQILLGLIILALLVAIIVLTRGKTAPSTTALPTVTLESVGSFGDDSNGVDVTGTVKSVSEAAILAQYG